MKTTTLLLTVALALLFGCSDPDLAPSPPALFAPDSNTDKPDIETQLAQLEEALAKVAGLTTEQLLEQSALPFGQLTHTPSEAAGLDQILASAYGPDDAELALLDQFGFVLTDNAEASFVWGYSGIFAADLPVYITADAILHAFHRSYDLLLADLEESTLIPELEGWLADIQQQLAAGAASPLGSQAAADLDLLVTVAHSLLSGRVLSPTAGASRAQVVELYGLALEAEGVADVELFGASRRMDFSQFKPRGHYTDSEELSNYFRAMIWLARTDLRLIETLDNGTQVFHRRELNTALAFRLLADATILERWRRLDAVFEALIGESDAMALGDVDGLLGDLNATSPTEVMSLTDDTLEQALRDGGYGAPRVCSFVMVAGPEVLQRPLPLPQTFSLLGQRFAVDAHVMSKLVNDRVADRDLPDPLDVAYAAFGNDHAATLLRDDLQEYDYAEALAQMRATTDSYDEAFWQSSLYNSWLQAIRTLSPDRAELQDPEAAGLPALMTTEAWARRMLNTQLGSWTELRHDNVLYVAQSYSAGAACEFPSAYVEPYPRFFAALAELAENASAALEGFQAEGKYSTAAYFEHVALVARRLEALADKQRAGQPYDEDDMVFINSMVSIEFFGCTAEDAVANGWYGQLYIDEDEALETDRLITDVHTGGILPGQPRQILHVGTWYPRAMVVTLQTCTGPQAYVGMVYSYHEQVTDEARLTDDEWEAMYVYTPPSPEWLDDFSY